MAREMKDSGIAWIGIIPTGWKVCPLKTSIKWKSEKNHAEATVLSLYRDYGIVPKDSRDDNYNVTSLDTSGYKYVEVGNLVINKMKAWQGSIAVSDYEGIVSPAYHVCQITNKEIYKRYLHYLLRDSSYLPEYMRLSTGLRIGQWDLGFDDFKNIPFILPSHDEQKRIVSFLDTECSRIDSVIEQTRASIEEYKKLKQAVITQAVTKGIRPGREMKDSGLIWIGRIPNEWRVVSVGRLFSISAGGDAKPEYYSDIRDDEHPYPVFTNSMNKNQVYAYTSNPVFEKDTITVTGRGAIGIAFYRDTAYDAIIRLLSLRPKLDLDGRFYAYWINNVIHFFTDSAAVGQLSSVQMASYRTVYCSKAEQIEIADYLDEKCVAIDRIIEQKEQLLMEMESYKKSLIYEYVTGKKEVPACQ